MIATSKMIKASIYVQFRSLSNICNLVRSFKKFKFSLNFEGKIRTIGKRDRNEVENFLQAEWDFHCYMDDVFGSSEFFEFQKEVFLMNCNNRIHQLQHCVKYRHFTQFPGKKIWVKVFKNGPSKISGRQLLKNFPWSILAYLDTY